MDSHTGTALSSQNQGNPVCWSDPKFAPVPNIDCTPDQVCDTRGLLDPCIRPGIGVCVYQKAKTPKGDIGGLSPQNNCPADGTQGAACGNYGVKGYPDALGYTCNAVTINKGGYKKQATMACVPPFDPGGWPRQL